AAQRNRNEGVLVEEHELLLDTETRHGDGSGFRRCRRRQSLKASLTSSPAFFRSALACSALPSASSFSLSVTLPAASFMWPAMSSAACLALSPIPIDPFLSSGICTTDSHTDTKLWRRG